MAKKKIAPPVTTAREGGAGSEMMVIERLEKALREIERLEDQREIIAMKIEDEWATLAASGANIAALKLVVRDRICPALDAMLRTVSAAAHYRSELEAAAPNSRRNAVSRNSN